MDKNDKKVLVKSPQEDEKPFETRMDTGLSGAGQLAPCGHCAGAVEWCDCGACGRLWCPACKIMTEFSPPDECDTLDKERAFTAAMWNRRSGAPTQSAADAENPVSVQGVKNGVKATPISTMQAKLDAAKNRREATTAKNAVVQSEVQKLHLTAEQGTGEQSSMQKVHSASDQAQVQDELAQLRGQNLLLVGLYDAAAKLIKAKGRFHTEQNYRALVDAYDLARQADAKGAGSPKTCRSSEKVQAMQDSDTVPAVVPPLSGANIAPVPPQSVVTLAPQSSQSEGTVTDYGTSARNPAVEDVLSTLLWLYRRLPQCYGRPPFIEHPIQSLADKVGIEVDQDLAQRGPAPADEKVKPC